MASISRFFEQLNTTDLRLGFRSKTLRVAVVTVILVVMWLRQLLLLPWILLKTTVMLFLLTGSISMTALKKNLEE